MSPNSTSLTRNRTAGILLVSFVMLFVEIALIRYLSTEARVFAYVNNLVLLSCFLGIGLGCYYSRRKAMLGLTAAALAAIILMIRLPLTVTIEGRELHLFRDVPVLISSFTDSLIWFEPGSGPVVLMTVLGLVATMIVFGVVLIAFVPLGQALGRLLDDHKNAIVAYSINVAASILGIWCFAGFSFVYSPPWSWFALAVLCLIVLLLLQSERTKFSWISIFLLSGAVVYASLAPSGAPNTVRTVWSPYQKLELSRTGGSTQAVFQPYRINVNNVGYMVMLDLSDAVIEANPSIYSKSERRLSQYDIPYLFKDDARDVLILGAGAGNDVAGALRHGVESVDAVEIDPGIYELGVEFHPEEPYTDPRVDMIIDDARSYLKRSTRTYDMISFGLLDAHTLSSSYNNMRIDHYVYTLESFREARDRLRDDGVMTVSFEAQRPWIQYRIYGLLTEVFGHPPLAFEHRYSQGRYGWGGSMFVTARDFSIVERALEQEDLLRVFTSGRRISPPESSGDDHAVRLTTDDWPYLYLETPGIPNMHLSIMIILSAMFLLAGKLVLFKGRSLNLHFFFLGAAFLLLEFQNISKSTLLFGSTWLVNSFIITGILLLVLLANLFVSVVKLKNLRIVYILLIASCLLVYVIPLSLFNFLGYWEKALAGSFILNLPIFFGGIIFIESFKRTSRKDLAFGSNLLGAAVGGILESVSFLIGINALLLLVIVFYVLSFLTARSRGPQLGLEQPAA